MVSCISVAWFTRKIFTRQRLEDIKTEGNLYSMDCIQMISKKFISKGKRLEQAVVFIDVLLNERSIRGEPTETRISIAQNLCAALPHWHSKTVEPDHQGSTIFVHRNRPTAITVLRDQLVFCFNRKMIVEIVYRRQVLSLALTPRT